MNHVLLGLLDAVGHVEPEARNYNECLSACLVRALSQKNNITNTRVSLVGGQPRVHCWALSDFKFEGSLLDAILQTLRLFCESNLELGLVFVTPDGKEIISYPGLALQSPNATGQSLSPYFICLCYDAKSKKRPFTLMTRPAQSPNTVSMVLEDGRLTQGSVPYFNKPKKDHAIWDSVGLGQLKVVKPPTTVDTEPKPSFWPHRLTVDGKPSTSPVLRGPSSCGGGGSNHGSPPVAGG